MIFSALGATNTISASCHFLYINGTGIILDAGVDPEAEGEESLPDFDRIHQRSDWYVDHALISHAHHDHIGSLPVLLQHFPHAKVHMTFATRELADFVLPASARLQRRKMREGSSLHPPLFSEDEVDVYSYLYLAHETGRPFDVTGLRARDPIKATLYSAGHILGSAGVLLEFREDDTDRSVFYSSDTNLRSQTIIPGADYPEGPVDCLILESTLGADADAEKTTRRLEEQRFTESLRMIIERGGSALIPVFAMGRAQETLALVQRCKLRGVIPDDTPVYTAGGLRAVSDLYDKLRFTTPRLDHEFQVFGVEQKRLPRSTEAIAATLEQPGIYVISSGMMFERTLSNKLAQMIIEDEKNGVMLVGFAREDSPAHRLLEAYAQAPGTEAVLDEDIGPQPVRASVERFLMSSHSNRRDLISIVDRLAPKHVILVHGEEEARTWLADNIRFFYPDVTVHVPGNGDIVEL